VQYLGYQRLRVKQHRALPPWTLTISAASISACAGARIGGAQVRYVDGQVAGQR